ncbi:hypothetical protein LUZ61_008711 [Rhynchospora tenuis]|uniref:RNA-directed DNA polymerase n=1 Tax=Rhynchospora tenuis TaxID=198213 RepID=A0AAD5ZVV7_9POAL|nr:hypothetical protein LUZ61_008711 [Rhynchospora tenuis]
MSRTQTKVETEPPRPSVTGMGPNTTTPTIQDQIRGYRLGARLRYEAQRRLPGRSRSYNRTLESQMSPDAELNISQYRRAQQVPAETLYRAGWVQIPQDANIHTRTDGSLSIRFANYTTTAPPNNDIQRGTADEEELEQESINLLTPDEYWPWEINEELGELPEEFGELPEIPENWPNDETILGAWFTNMLRLEEPAIEYLEPIYPYVWCDQFDDTDPIIQLISEEISWAELVDNEQYWHQDEQALMMTCQWDESDEDESDELEHFLNALHSPTEPDLLSLLVGQGGKDCGLPQIPQVSDESEIRWDPEPSESIYVVEDMEYPLLKQLIQKESVFSTAESALTRMPSEPIMGPAMYPPASSSRQPTGLQVPEIRARLNNIRGGYANQMNERYNLPSAQANQGAILVLPEDIGLYEDVFSRWESITLNLINERNWADNRAKVNYIENLLGEIEKKMWIQWRMIYHAEYEELINIADDPQNVLSQIRRMFLMEDPATGSTDEQNRAYQDLERLSCNYVKDIFNYINDYKILAAKSGRMYVSEELSVKFFRKMPPILGNEIEKAFAEKYPGNTIGVMPRIKFTYDFLAEQCKRAALQRSLKDLTFCSQIPVPGYYQKSKRYGLRKSKTYRGKPHDTHIRVFKKKHSDKVRKCKCFICGEEGHFARECKKQQGNIARAAIVDNLDLDDDWDVLSVDLNEPDSDAICSFSEGEGSNGTTFTASIENLPYESAFMLNTTSSWRYIVPLPEEMKNCVHEWEDNSPIPAEHIRCKICKDVTNQKMRAHCVRCFLTVCPMCSRFQLGRQLIIQKSTLQYDSKDALIRELVEYANFLLAENQRLKERILELELSTEMKELPKTDKGKGLDIPRGYVEELDYDIPQSSKGITIKMMNDEYISTQVPDPQRGRRVLNRLYNIKIQIEIPGCEKFAIQAILDTGATICCVDEGAIPEAALEPSAYPIQINGVNSKQIANKKLKGGMMSIEENRFRIPFTYVFPMAQSDGIQMLIGCNFIRAMQGGLRIEGQMVTFYKNITTIATKVEAEVASAVSISELDLTELEFQEIQRAVAYPCGVESTKFKEKFNSLLNRLREQGYIGEEPMKYWSKNQVVCKLDIINPDITIQDKPLKHITPAMNEQFNKHIQALLKIGVIRPSKSRHRTMAMMVNSGTSIDPKTGQEVKGKERMVFNYRTLNDNTLKDQYSLPGINTILKKVGNSRVFSKFDLKSGFHQVAMDPESVEWTAFVVPGGLYEWLVMPFGLKNAPAIFQRKMDDCFRGTEDFIAVYIDDILVFSENEEQHAKHLETMLAICEKWGLVLSPTKMKIAVPEIEFLGAVIGNQKIKLQPHIIKKIISFDENRLKEKSGMRSWLGILNYARSYIPKLGTILGPLYSKTSEHGDKRLKSSDYEIINKVKSLVQNLPDLEFPPQDSYIILETDGCMEGWGGVCKWKNSKYDPRSSEKVCAYASGKFQVLKSTIDAEIHACMETMSALKIHYLDKQEITLRTDCQAIISFYNKSASNKPSRVRWISFVDFVTGTGVKVNFEHIDGKLNVLADSLSRLTAKMVSTVNCCTIDRHLEELESVLRKLEEAPSSNSEKFVEIINNLNKIL